MGVGKHVRRLQPKQDRPAPQFLEVAMIKGGTMAEEKLKGAVNDAKGRVKRQAGEWTGNTDLKVEGTKDQAKGKIQKAAGKVKDAARNATRSDKEDVA
jgi:uncharacterized protein YjbJ (UPF0337 family)